MSTTQKQNIFYTKTLLISVFCLVLFLSPLAIDRGIHVISVSAFSGGGGDGGSSGGGDGGADSSGGSSDGGADSSGGSSDGGADSSGGATGSTDSSSGDSSIGGSASPVAPSPVAGGPVSTPTPVSVPTCSLSVGKTSLVSGDSTSLSWTSTNATSGAIDNGVGSSVAVSGVTTIKPSSATTYTGTFTGTGGSVTCSVSVSVTAAGGPGSYGGPGGLDAPTVSVSSLNGPGAQPLAFITLSQIPYTGFEAGAIVTMLYWLVLILWSGSLAYFLLTYNVKMRFVSILKGVLGTNTHIKPASTSTVKESAPDIELAEDALEEVRVAGDMLVLETGTDGKTPRIVLKRSMPASVARTEDEMQSAPVVAGHQDTLIMACEDVVGDTPTGVLLHAIAQGDTSRVLKTVQEYKASKKDTSEMLAALICELDRLHMRRQGETEQLSDESVAGSFASWSDADIAQVIHVLSTGIDQNYATQYTSAKVALLRALEYGAKR